MYIIMGVSINGGIPYQWLVYKGKSTYKWMIWGYPILGNPDVLLFEFFTLDKADIDIFLLAEMWIFVLREYVLFFGELRISKFKVTAYDKVTKLLYK